MRWKKELYKTHEGAARRAQFESAHDKKYSWSVQRYLGGAPDSSPLSSVLLRDKMYTWRVCGMKRPRS